ncbi:MAG: nucleotidyl transferase AbiEii/AbiGii toxin family protein [Elusimicrobia bacterium]|nr:nucleotidyl transferase AbiEii/AbiGii toxin family protein [Elusimicrobiota bacterium]
MNTPWHPQAITPNVQKAVAVLNKMPQLEEFYLAGGTALALQLGHRISVDLDFFSSANILNDKKRQNLKQSLQLNANFKIRQEETGTLHITVGKAFVSFLYYNYALLKPAKSWQAIRIASIEDIALMKIGAVIGRGAKKDFIDLYAVCKKISLPALLNLADKKFPNTADFALQAAKALVYFDDAEKDPMPQLLKPLEWNQVKRYFELETPKAIKSILK